MSAPIVSRLIQSMGVFFAACTCLVTHSVTLALPVRAADELPRYRFEVGQEISYACDSMFKFGSGEEAGTFLDRMDFTAWVVRKNDNGTWRLAIRQVTTSRRLDHEGKERVDPQRALYAYCDMTSDGEFAHNESMQGSLYVSWLFPRLPVTAAQMKQGWSAKYAWDETHVHSEPEMNGNEAVCRFREIRRTMLDPVYLFKWNTLYDFGRKEGFIAKAEHKYSQGVGFVGEGTEKWSLTHIKRLTPSQGEQLATETARFFSAKIGHQAISDAIARNPTEITTLIAKTRTETGKVLEECSTGEVQAMCNEYLKNLKENEVHYLERAAKCAELLDKPSPDWETTDWDGKKHALADYRGKVVLLEFWYRGCGWCIRAMPQINQLHDEFKDRGVVVLGMNEDDEEADARAVVDVMSLRYPTLKNNGIHEKYIDSGYPTLMLIDQLGIVRHIHVGYSATLRDELAEQIKKLLAKPAESK